MVKISIIVPVYNVEKYLPKCLESLIHQTLKDIEIICINDGSTDNSLSILKDYAKNDSRIRIINKENGGISATRNSGINAAMGDFLSFIDSDDWIDLDFFEKLYLAAKKYSADIAAAGIIRISGRRKRVLLDFKKEIVTDDTNEKFRLCDIPDKSYTCNKIYRTSKIKDLNILFKDNIIYEDIIFTPEAVHKLGALITVPGTYYFYYKRRGSITNTKSNNKSHAEALNAANKYFEEHNINVKFHTTTFKRYKIFGQTVFKIKSKGKLKEAILFNFIKWKL